MAMPWEKEWTTTAAAPWEKQWSEPAGGIDRAQAAASGVNSGALTGLLGLPVDTLLNVKDLATAGYGALKGALGSTDLPEVNSDRSDIVGSREWLAKQFRKAGVGIDPARPDDTASRYLHAGGNALGASMFGVRTPQGYNAAAAAAKQPNLIAQAARDAGMAATSGMTAQGAAEATDNPAWAILAGMAPQAATFGAAAATRGPLRGGEASRQEMADRLETLTGAGVKTPSVGLTTGNRRTQALESLLTRVPGSAGVLAKNAEAVSEQLGAQAGRLADRSAMDRGPETAGTTVRGAIGDYRTRQQDIERRLLDRVEQVIPADALYPTNATTRASAEVTSPIPGAPSITGVRDSQRGFINRMTGAVERDAAPMPPQQVPSSIVGPDGRPFTTTLPGRPGGLPFEALRNMKTLIGENAYPAANQLVTDQGTGAAKRLYGGAKDDIRNAAALTSPLAVARMEKADKFYAKTQKILEDVLQPIYKGSEGAPEKAFYSIERGANNAGSLTRQTILSLPAEARAQVSATVIDRLGKATPGQQNDAGTAFSPATFLTNWSKITPAAKDSLFMGYKGAASVRDGLDKIAATTSMIREKGRVFPNPSGTSNAMVQYGMVSSMIASPFSGSPLIMGAAFGAPVMAYAGAKLMTSPTFVSWLAKSTTVPESRVKQHVLRLSVNATGEKDPEKRAAINELADYLRDQLNEPPN